MLLILVLMEGGLENVWLLNLNEGNILMLFSWLMVLLLLIELGERDFLLLVLLRDMLPKMLLFIEILIWGDLISFPIVIYVTWRRIDWGTMILRGWWFKSVSKHCLIHLIFNNISTLLLSIIFVLRGNNLLEALRHLMRFFGSIVFLFILLNH